MSVGMNLNNVSQGQIEQNNNNSSILNNLKGSFSNALSAVRNAPFALQMLGGLAILGSLAGATTSPPPTITFTSGNNSTAGQNGTTQLTTNSTTTYSTTGRPTTQTTLLPTSPTTNATSTANSPFTQTTTQLFNHTSTQQQTTVGHTNNTTPTEGHASTSAFTATVNPTNHTTNGTIPTLKPDHSGDIALWGIVGGFVLAGVAIGTIGYKLLGDDGKEITIDLTPTGESVRAYNERLRTASREIVEKFAAKKDSSDKSIHNLWDSLQPICEQLSQVRIHTETNLDEESQISLRDHDFGGIFYNYVYSDLVNRVGQVQIDRCEESYKPVTGLQRYIERNEGSSMLSDFIAGTKRAFTEAGTETINYILNKRA